ncbi:Per1-like family protein [Actinidia rufa]|uniref:Post-GPI attachment to proteins factor 3 n=1 Tax=Actinidia rufa TaxID=165716 RepID=A0A7J0EA55_9ERIC|nr:Per1-like family protein [Actinidia rufa]
MEERIFGLVSIALKWWPGVSPCNYACGCGRRYVGGEYSVTAVACVEQCEKTGCVGTNTSNTVNFLLMESPLMVPGICKNHSISVGNYGTAAATADISVCLLGRKREKKHGGRPVKYRGAHFSRALSALNLVMQFQSWVSFFILVNYKFPLRPNKRTYYEYTGLLHMYALLAMNSWFWSAVFHSRDVDLTEKLYYSSAMALIGFSLILAILRAVNVRDEAARVMVAAPLIAFATTHILYLNFYQLDYGLNMKVCMGMGMAQLFIWAVWAGVTCHPSRWKLWVVVIGGSLSPLLEIYDFPPYWGFVDAHSLWHATTIPLTYLWWSFIMDDTEFRTSTLIKKAK